MTSVVKTEATCVTNIDANRERQGRSDTTRSLNSIALFLAQVDGLVLMAGDAGANLRRRPAGLGFVIGVETFSGADVAFGGVRCLVATMQAGVSEGAIAAAVARELVDDAGDLRGQLIDANLPVIAEVRARQLSSVKNGRQCVNIERS